MDIQKELALSDLYDALTSQQRWPSTDKRHVGEWLGELAAQTIGTSDKVIFSEGVKTYGPIVGYEEMATLLTSDLKGKILCWFRYNSDSKTWTVGPLIVTLPASMEEAIKTVKKEIEEARKQRKRFTPEEIFKGLMLLKGCTAKLSYSSWLETTVQMLLYVNCQRCSDYDHRHKDDPQISWREAMDEFISETEPDMRLKAVYSLTDENGKEGDNTITFHDLLWTPSWMNGN